MVLVCRFGWRWHRSGSLVQGPSSGLSDPSVVAAAGPLVPLVDLCPPIGETWSGSAPGRIGEVSCLEDSRRLPANRCPTPSPEWGPPCRAAGLNKPEALAITKQHTRALPKDRTLSGVLIRSGHHSTTEGTRRHKMTDTFTVCCRNSVELLIDGRMY